MIEPIFMNCVWVGIRGPLLETIPSRHARDLLIEQGLVADATLFGRAIMPGKSCAGGRGIRAGLPRRANAAIA
jgi:hypothetical protein